MPWNRTTLSDLLSGDTAAVVRKIVPRPTPPHPEDYRPYNTLPEFMEGYHAYRHDDYRTPYDADSVAAQAWDRGLDYGMRLARFNRIEE